MKILPGEADNQIRRIADYERLSGIFWIGLGAIQVCMLWTAVAGIWNTVAAITRWKLPDRIRGRDPALPELYRGINQLVIIGIVNLLLGGIIGILFVVFDLFIRDQVLTNAHLFTGTTVAPSSASPSPALVPPAAGDFDQQLRILAQLRDDGVITEADFEQKKRSLLGF